MGAVRDTDWVNTDWVIVIPVKTAGAKSRFGAGDHSALAMAMALDTVAVAVGVGRVVVVAGEVSTGSTTGGSTTALARFVELGAEVVSDPGGGLNPAIMAALDHAGLRAARAVLLADHPALTAVELMQALGAAADHPLAFVADAEGDGTAITTAAPGVPHAPRFGAGSAAAHRAAGYVELFGAWPGLRRDVDLAEQLRPEALTGLILGPRTALSIPRT